VTQSELHKRRVSVSATQIITSLPFPFPFAPMVDRA